jgi:hypothetical protein
MLCRINRSNPYRQFADTPASQTEKSITVAVRYAAAGYGEPGDVVLAFVGLLTLAGAVVLGMVSVKGLAPHIERAWARYVLMALVVLVTLGVGYVGYTLLGQYEATGNAMHMHKLYRRKMAVVAPYLSPQEAREIDSQWARMNGKADLEAIDERLLALMRQHGLASGSPPAVKPAD